MTSAAGRGGEPPPLLLLLTSPLDPGSYAVAPCLARLARAAGWVFDVYVHPPGLGRHFGGGRPAGDRARGTSFAGGGHAEQLQWLARHHRVTAVGHPYPAAAQVLDDAGAAIVPTGSAVETYRAAVPLLGSAWPGRLLVLDGREQGPHGITTAAYCYPELLREDVLAVDAGEYPLAAPELRRLGVTGHEARWVAPQRQDGLGLPPGPRLGRRTYAEFTAECARPHRQWARGLLLADPELALSCVPRAAELRLAPLYGRPQIDAVDAYAPAAASLPAGAWGRQFDDRDFLWLSRRGLPMQLVDPGPPLHSVSAWNRAHPRRMSPVAAGAGSAAEPSDGQLAAWAADGRILATLVWWCGMVRELDAVPAVADLVAATGLRAGLALTVPGAEHLRLPLSALAAACAAAGGQLELLMASVGRGLAFESVLPAAGLGPRLAAARRELESATGCAVRGWWPLLDGPLAARRFPPKVREGRLVSPFDFAGRADEDRRLTGQARGPLLPRLGAMQARPFDWRRPGPPAPALCRAAADAGLDYLVSKHRPRAGSPGRRQGGCVVLPAVADWGGWTPFRTVGSAGDVARIERRLARAGPPGCLVATVDAPLWLLSGERWRHGPRMHALATLVARGGRGGRLVNASPATVARYAALLAGRRG